MNIAGEQLQVNDGSNFFKMLHRLFSVNGAAARCNDAFIGFQSRIDLILNRKKAFNAQTTPAKTNPVARR